MKGGKIYLLIFIAIAIAVFLFTQHPSLNIENFESEGISWWVWVLIALAGIPIVFFVIQMINNQNQKEELREFGTQMKENRAAWNSKERARKANHEASTAQIESILSERRQQREAAAGGGAKKNRTKSKHRSAK